MTGAAALAWVKMPSLSAPATPAVSVAASVGTAAPFLHLLYPQAVPTQ